MSEKGVLANIIAPYLGLTPYENEPPDQNSVAMDDTRNRRGEQFRLYETVQIY